MIHPDPIDAEQLDHAAGASIASHRHAYGQLGVVLRGTMGIETQDGRWLAPMGRGIWVPPDLEHVARYGEASQIVLVRVAPAYTQNLPPHGAGLAISGLLRELALAVAQGPKEKAEAELLALLLAREIQKKQDGSGLFISYGRDPRLRRATAALVAAPGEAMSLSTLAVQAGASPRTLERLFEAETGLSFARWREHLRVNLAIDRLIMGQTITQTALALGYQSPAAFSTMFARLLGRPPSRFLKQLEGNAQGSRHIINLAPKNGISKKETADHEASLSAYRAP